MTENEAGIDCVALMREIRDRLNAEVAELSPEQRRDYIRRSAERMRRELPLPDYPAQQHQQAKQAAL
jgi:hypothetical protein